MRSGQLFWRSAEIDSEGRVSRELEPVGQARRRQLGARALFLRAFGALLARRPTLVSNRFTGMVSVRRLGVGYALSAAPKLADGEWRRSAGRTGVVEGLVLERSEARESGSRVSASGEVTQWLERLRSGESAAFDELVPLLYAELRQMARSRLRGERQGHTLETTALVHETYVKLRRSERLEAEDRNAFLAIAGRAMRNILVDHARTRTRQKRGGRQNPIPLEDVEELLSHDEAHEMVALDEALSRLEELNPEGARVVELRFFSGLSLEEVAEQTELSERTVRRRWTAARAWLRKEMKPQRFVTLGAPVSS